MTPTIAARVLADNCGSLSDCFSGNLLPAILLIAGLILLLAGSWYLWPVVARLAVPVMMRQLLGGAVRSRAGYAAARFFSRFASRVVQYPPQNLQHAFKHAKDFGITSNWSKAAGEAFRKALEAHVRDPGTLVRNGWYHGQRVTHFFNPRTGLNVIRDLNGNVVSGWRLSPGQLWHLLRTGKLGGG
jgi:hypothetical protein